MRGRRLSKSKDLPCPNRYVTQLLGEFSLWAYEEERSADLRAQWRQKAFGVSNDHPMDLEIGTGNGFHFAERAMHFPNRALVGIEIKYKPLIQTIRRAVRNGSTNARIIRFNASCLQDLFGPEELNDVLIHFPDPWPKKKHFKHRLIQDDFLKLLFSLQRPGSMVEFKTDNRDYFEWTMERAHKSPYSVIEENWDLHRTCTQNLNGASEASSILSVSQPEKPFITHFENIFMKQGLPIMRTVWLKPNSQ